MPAPSRHWRATLALIGIPLLIALLLFGVGAYLDFASASPPRLQGARWRYAWTAPPACC